MADQDTSTAPDAGDGATDDDVLTEICVKCGNEYYFSNGERPEELKCEKCGGTVFRSFASGGGEASEDFEESTGRDLNSDDAEGDTLPGDLLDLKNQ